MNFAVIEVGSTTTKAYYYENGKLTDLGRKLIPFKTNYKFAHKLVEEDIGSLYSFVEEIRSKVENIHIFGTSAFRNLTVEQKEQFLQDFQAKFACEFKIVSADEESNYTVKGVLANNDYRGKLAVFIGGGGYTEVAFVDNKEIIKKVNLPFGAMDITHEFPDLKEDITTTPFETIYEYTSKLVGDLGETADTAVLAGGDYIYFYESIGYEMEKNEIYEDINQPYMLEISQMDQYDHDVLNKSLEEIKDKCQDNSGWWDGARGMRFCMNALSKKVHAKYIVPTKINMLIGLIDEISKLYQK